MNENKNFVWNWENLDDFNRQFECEDNREQIVCPYCGFIKDTCWDEEEQGYNHQEGFEYECENCQKSFIVEAYVAIFFSSRKNEEEHKE